MPSTTQAWLSAFRLRTLPLAFSSIILGAFLAAKEGAFNGAIFAASLLTTLFLQVLSNLANDYGDFMKGTDNEARVGPSRTVQAGLISPNAMKIAIVLFSILSLFSGIGLLYFAGAFSDMRIFWFFLGTGLFCILAAITYTVGNNAYGYKGLGDIAVFIFFGLVGVLGTYFLMSYRFKELTILPAISCGLLAVGVLNLNNLRDIENDRASGKRSIPVMIGYENGKIYHYLLIVLSAVFMSIYLFTTFSNWLQLLPIILFPIYVFHILKVKSTLVNRDLDPFLKQLALISLATSVLFGIGLL